MSIWPILLIKSVLKWCIHFSSSKYLFSAPEPKRSAQVQYCDHALSVVRRPSDVNFSHFRLLLWNHWTECKETWQEATSQRPLPSLCFSGRSQKQDGRPGLWLLRHFRLLLWNRWTEFRQRNFTGSKISTSSTKIVFFGLIGKTKTMAALAFDWLRHFRLLLWNRWTEFQKNLTGSKISISSTSFVFFGRIGKTRWPPWSPIGRDIFDFSTETAKQNSTKVDRKQDRNVLYQVCVFLADRGKKTRWPYWPLIAETFLTSPLKPLNRIQQNLTGSKISTSLYFSGRSVNKNGRPGWYTHWQFR